MYNTRVDGTPSDPRETKVRNFGVSYKLTHVQTCVCRWAPNLLKCGPTPLVTLVHALVADQRH